MFRKKGKHFKESLEMERFQFLKKHKVWFMSVNIFNFLLKNVTTVKFESKGKNFLSVYNDSSLARS